MTGDRSAREGSSTSHPRRSRSSSRSAPGSSTSRSPGEPAPARSPRRRFGAGAIRDLAARHGIRPTKSLGQHFLIDPNLARAIAADAGVAAGDRVVEVGAGLGSLTVALDAAGADVLAVEFDRRLVPALEEVTPGPAADLRVLHGRCDEARLADRARRRRPGPWTLCANLPYNIAVPLVLDTLADVPAIVRWVVMVQREVGERLAASPGAEHFGAVSLRVAYRASATLVRTGAGVGVLAAPDGGLGRRSARPPRRAAGRRRRAVALAGGRRGVLRAPQDDAQRSTSARTRRRSGRRACSATRACRRTPVPRSST